MLKRQIAAMSRWIAAPWGAMDRAAQDDERRALLGGFAARGATNSSEAQQAYRQFEAKWRRRRIARRTFIALVLLVAISGGLSVFTTNRVPRAITAAATASTVPVALYLGLRRGG